MVSVEYGRVCVLGKRSMVCLNLSVCVCCGGQGGGGAGQAVRAAVRVES